MWGSFVNRAMTRLQGKTDWSGLIAVGLFILWGIIFIIAMGLNGDGPLAGLMARPVPGIRHDNVDATSRVADIGGNQFLIFDTSASSCFPISVNIVDPRGTLHQTGPACTIAFAHGLPQGWHYSVEAPYGKGGQVMSTQGTFASSFIENPEGFYRGLAGISGTHDKPGQGQAESYIVVVPNDSDVTIVQSGIMPH